jgi:hypothetical protein
MHLLCGAASLPQTIYWRGTIAGALMPTVAVCAVGGLLRRALLRDEPWTGAIGAAFGLALVAMMLHLRHRLLQQYVDRARHEQEERSRFG